MERRDVPVAAVVALAAKDKDSGLRALEALLHFARNGLASVVHELFEGHAAVDGVRVRDAEFDKGYGFARSHYASPRAQGRPGQMKSSWGASGGRALDFEGLGRGVPFDDEALLGKLGGKFLEHPRGDLDARAHGVDGYEFRRDLELFHKHVCRGGGGARLDDAG